MSFIIALGIGKLIGVLLLVAVVAIMAVVKKACA